MYKNCAFRKTGIRNKKMNFKRTLFDQSTSSLLFLQIWREISKINLTPSTKKNFLSPYPTPLDFKPGSFMTEQEEGERNKRKAKRQKDRRKKRDLKEKTYGMNYKIIWLQENNRS
jgi:hypothetical protein